MRPVIRLFAPIAIAASCLMSQTPVERPKIVGVAHIALRTADMEASRNFYGHDLGYPSIAGRRGEVDFMVNSHQYVEISPTLKDPQEDRLINIAFETTDARKLRDYMASKGVTVGSAPKPDAMGNLSFSVRDPEGHDIQFVQYGRKAHAAEPATDKPISDRIIHVGFVVHDQQAEDQFYKDILGFRETWHGGMNDTDTNWVDMRVPDGKDWLEYMLRVSNPTPKTRGVMDHLALGVPSVDAAYKTLTSRGMALGNEKPKIGRDGKWQLNLYDPDLTRAELMEPKPVRKPCCSPIVE